MYKNLIEQFKILYNNQSILSSITNDNLFDNLDLSEVHAIDIIGKSSDINGTKISEELNMTRSGVSKLTKKLIDKNLIESYKNENNKKEIYYELTNYGEEIFKKHKIAHYKWEQRDIEFFKTIDEKDIKTVFSFLSAFNKHLENQIKEV